jgi:mitochondrial fission protein ELM1
LTLMPQLRKNPRVARRPREQRSVATQLEGTWPYFREQPDCVVLGVRPGAVPSRRPPVRIFLGTEEGQYRAERVFVWSVERVRDPARVYEIHLMKNVAGFDRRGWRTGFTCYRFAIPDLAGRTGKAIYNDVDQIYLADPALLFDLELDGHGYLAIDARDTSVMLIDCEKMLPWWNRAAASAPGAKGPLTSKPAEVPGLWGELDPHWNARDLEYVEGRTRCLHYTALHQQPWNPFPESFSYHQNPLAYVWHDLEREADAAAFELFTRDEPSPGFRAIPGSNLPVPTAQWGTVLSPAAAALLRQTGVGRVLLTGMNGADAADLGADDVAVIRHDFARAQGRLPAERFDAVVAAGVFERIPGADVNWVLRELFAAAERVVVLRIMTTAEEGVGSEGWWRRRVEEIAAHYPKVSWVLDAVRRLPAGSLAVETIQVRRVEAPAKPLVWALTGEGAARDRQVLSVAAGLGWPVVEKRLAVGPLAWLRDRLRSATAGILDPAGLAQLTAPWPDVLITTGKLGLPVARWIRRQSGGRTRLVQLGRPGGPFALFDLIVATPDDRLPIRANVLQVAAPLAEAAIAGNGDAAPIAGLERPITALFVAPPSAPYVLSEANARELGKAASAEAERHDGSLVVHMAASMPPKLIEAIRGALSGQAKVLSAADAEGLLLASADRFIVTAGDAEMLSEACRTGKPVALFELPRWYDDLPVIRPLVRAALSVFGGDTYRGTPLQQHVVGRTVDWLTTRGLLYRPRDLHALYRSLEARGLVTRLGAEERVAAPRPLDDLPQVVARVRLLLSEVSQPV